VAGSLPKALAELGHDVRVVMPKYRLIKGDFTYITDFPVQLDQSVETCIVRMTEVPYKLNGRTKGLKVYFTDSYRLFDRDGIYGHFDDGERFVFFCKAVLNMLPVIGFRPDVIHCNDWHTGPICLLLKEKYSDDKRYNSISTLYTIHNLEYQGNFSSHIINLLNCSFDVFDPEKAEFYGMFNFMKTGLVYSDAISTVSRVYAEEIKTPQYGERLEGLLQRRSAICTAYSTVWTITSSTRDRQDHREELQRKQHKRKETQQNRAAKGNGTAVQGCSGVRTRFQAVRAERPEPDNRPYR
jgi:starch synthase